MRPVDLPNQQFLSGTPRDLAKKLGADGEKNILRIICNSYKKLSSYNRIKPTMSEPEITEQLYIELQEEWRQTDIPLIPIHEKSHGRREEGRGKTPTIDFCFCDRWDSSVYFGAECKLLAKDNNKLYRLYIDEGMNRYISGNYGKKCSIGLMIGYIIIGDTTEVIEEIKKRVNNLPNFRNMDSDYAIDDFTNHYKSIHERSVGLSPFSINHLFFSFT